MSISNEAIEAAQRAMMWKKLPFGGRDLEISLDANAAYAAAKLALTSAAPAIQAAALREAADSAFKDKKIQGLQRVLIGNWLRTRAAIIEGKSE